jgi:hypothetical protein
MVILPDQKQGGKAAKQRAHEALCDMHRPQRGVLWTMRMLPES